VYGLQRAAQLHGGRLDVALSVSDVLLRDKSYFFDADARTRHYLTHSTVDMVKYRLFYKSLSKVLKSRSAA
jgi:hypothetical protein